MSSKRIEHLSTTDASGGATYSSVHPFTVGDEFPCGLSVVVTGTANYTVQYSDNGGANWFDHDTLAGLTATASGYLSAATGAVRLKQSSGNGSCVLTVVEAKS